MNLSRRAFITSAALAPVACGMPLSYENGTPVPQPSPLPSVRLPELGQEWTYVKRDVFNGKILGVLTERVAQVGSTIVIERSLADGAQLPSEIQSAWGMVTTDPQWPRLLHFNPALPLWPQESSSKWSKQLTTHYTIGDYSDSKLDWQEYMSAEGWEKITVPAGVFVALRYQTQIHYQSDDDNKVDCMRKETMWFAPTIGRWVAREASGSYEIQGQLGGVINEGSYRWELTAYK